MSFPKTEEELEAAGYKFLNAARCRGCNASIEWWETPNGKKMPMNDDYEPHWATCPSAPDFRKKGGD